MSTWLAAIAGGVAVPVIVAVLLYGLRQALAWRVRRARALEAKIRASLLRRPEAP